MLDGFVAEVGIACTDMEDPLLRRELCHHAKVSRGFRFDLRQVRSLKSPDSLLHCSKQSAAIKAIAGISEDTAGINKLENNRAGINK
jgi:hypothetical protein